MTTRFRVLAVAATLTMAPVFSACAYAQYGNYPRGGYGTRAPAYAFDIGYREGLQRGERDARRGRGINFHNDRDYQRADKGWNPRYGSREAYRYEFRRGYERGYRDAFERSGYYGRDDRRYPDRGRYPGGAYPGRDYPRGGYGYRSPAAEFGFNEGYEKGREDARDGDRYDPVRHKWYREGDRHYNGRYGSRDEWKYEYREAFKQGYERGYREGRY